MTANAAVIVIASAAHAGSAGGGLAERVQDAYRNTESFSASFTQKTVVEVLDREVSESGELVFSKPGRFSIRYGGKRERHYLSDGETLWIYHPKDKEVEVIDHVQDVVSKEALAFLGGLGEMSKEFKVSEGKDDSLTLVPRSKSSPFSKIILTVDPADHLARGATLFPKGGNKSEYVFSAVRANEPVSESTFKFSKSGVREIRPLAAE
ncbi:MAG TPA: outer membrane lipoprotein carrier protein LolA [bacterium]|nr:outer membrane lipoprotein carrier protein LolA [bacterium]